MKKLISIFSELSFFFVNIIGNLFIPYIKEKQVRDVRICPYNKKYLTDMIKIWNSFEEAHFGKIQKLLLMFFGKKTCFVMVKDEKPIGFIFFYFRFNDLINHRIHSASGVMNSIYRRSGYGALLFISAWDSFKKVRFIHGISCRYTLDNIQSKRLHEKYGFKVKSEYFDPHLRKQRVYAICSWK